MDSLSRVDFPPDDYLLQSINDFNGITADIYSKHDINKI